MTPIPLLVIDAHVHVYDCFALPRFLDAACSNQMEVARKRGCERFFISVLMLAEGCRDHVFQRLSMECEKGNDKILGDGFGGYRVFATEEAESLRIEDDAGVSLFLISGKQIVTMEGLEVLALATTSEIPDGLALGEAVETSAMEGALVVIPWSFGKWIGRRGKVLREFLASHRDVKLFLGDNGGRPAFLRFPEFHRTAILKVLPGSDPLPLASEEAKAGSYGFTLRENLDIRRPAEDLKRILFHPGVSPAPYGLQESPFRFARNQTILRIWNRRI